MFMPFSLVAVILVGLSPRTAAALVSIQSPALDVENVRHGMDL